MSDSTIDPELTQRFVIERDRRKRRRIWWIILSCLVLIYLLTFVETRVFQIGEVPFPVSGNVLVFVLINVNVLLLLLMIFLVLRNLVQLVFERKRRILGTRLKTKLVLSFVSLSLIPTGLLFFIALQFVSSSMDYWFNSRVEQSLQESLKLARSVYDQAKKQVLVQGSSTADRLASGMYQDLIANHLDIFLKDIAASHGLAGLELYSGQRGPLARVFADGIDPDEVPDLPPDMFRRAQAGEERPVTIQKIRGGELVRSAVAVRGADGGAARVLVTSVLIPAEKLASMEVISSGLEGYRQLMLLKNPIKTSLLVMLLIITLLIVFASIWFGFYVARGLTGPIAKLARATKRVAEGDLDFVLTRDSGDEMGTLVDSFNQMTRDLLASKKQLEERRQYMETILQNITAGVISMDPQGRITTINSFAETLLRIRSEDLVGRDWREVLNEEHREIMEGFFESLENSGRASIQRSIRLRVRDESFYLRVNFTRLRDERGNDLGVVLVFDNLTEIEKMQRMAAWREVARRIAHEVKNPLTPVQLSAQRLRKRYLDRLAGEDEVFDSCTMTIIKQVEELKRLVAEFSTFARMPGVNKEPGDLAALLREVMVLYREAHRKIDFSLDIGSIPVFPFDLTQMRRVLINLLDNAVAVAGEGRIEVSARMDGGEAVIEVADNGPGIADEDKARLFEPYFSTKKGGSGLGLAIAGTIVSDHGGTIRVEDNEPNGARFIIRLPVSGGKDDAGAGRREDNGFSEEKDG